MEAARGIGDNSAHFGEDEPLSETPRKLTKAEKLDWAYQTQLAAKLLAALAGIPKKRVIGKRQGQNGLVLRCILSETMIVRGCPKHFLARLYDVARDVPGDDEKMVWRWRDDERLNSEIGFVEAWLNDALNQKLSDTIALCRAMEEPDDEEVDDEHVVSIVTRKAPSLTPEEKAYVERRQAEERLAYVKKLMAICLSTIEKNQGKQTKEAQKHARHAAKELEALGLEMKQLQKALKPKRRVGLATT